MLLYYGLLQSVMNFYEYPVNLRKNGLPPSTAYQYPQRDVYNNFAFIEPTTQVILNSRYALILGLLALIAACSPQTQTFSVTVAPTEIGGGAPVYSPTPTLALTATPTLTITPSPTLTPTLTPTPTLTATPSPSFTPTQELVT